MKRLLNKSALALGGCYRFIAAGVVLSLATVTYPVMATTTTSSTTTPINTNNFDITIENAGVQSSQLATNPSAYGATDVYVDNFDSNQTGFYSGSNSNNTLTWVNGSGNNATTIGTFTNALVQSANEFGGAGGTGNFFDVNQSISKASYSQSNITTATLTFTTQQRYFGIDWSAGDAYNQMQFYNGNQLIETFTTADVINYLKSEPNTSAYYGNPNSNFKNQDSSEPFAYLNFFADPNNSGITFNKIVFTDTGSTGFEADNFTVAANYGKLSGTVIKKVPESSSILGLMAIGFFGAASLGTRQLKKSLRSF